MEILKRIIKTFSNVVTGSLISAALFITIFVPKVKLDVALLWEIIVIAAVCSLGTFILYYKRTLTKKQMKIRIICHYLYINIIVLSGGLFWEWFTPGLFPELLVMLLLIAVVYAIIMLTTFHMEEKMAEKLNQQLHKFYPEQEEGEDS